MNQWLKKVRNSVKVKEWWKILISKVRGHFQYYGFSRNILWITKYYTIVVRIVKKWLIEEVKNGNTNGRSSENIL